MTDSRLAIYPSPLGLLAVLRRPSEPFVMLNLLAFKEHATGNHAGVSGREAYEQYARGAMEVQGPMGSKLLWIGDVTHRYASDSPALDTIAALQYASPRTFLRFVFRGGSDTKSRKAGLLGQWLLASSTNCYASAAEGPVLVELLDGEPWGAGGRVVWSGSCDARVIGTGPQVTRAIVTTFDDDSALNAGLNQRRADRPDTTTTWWPYRANTAHYQDDQIGDRNADDR